MESSTITSVGAANLACHNCARTTEFEQPPCPDGHGCDCPEWYCTECGSATFVGWSIERREPRRRSGDGRHRTHVA